MKRAKQLHDEKAERAEAMRALLAAAEDENRSLTDEEAGRFDELSAEFDERAAELERLDRMRQIDTVFDQHRDEGAERTGRSRDEIDGAIEAYDQAYARHLRYGMGLAAEDHEVLRRGLPMLTGEENARAMQEWRQQATTPGAVGGYLTSVEMVRRITEFMAQFGGVEGASQVITTSTGSGLDWPLMDTSGEEGEIVGENVAVAETDDLYDQRSFGSFKYSSKRVRLSLEIMQDSLIDIVGITAQRIGTRIGRIKSKHLAAGTGTGQPEGIMTAAPSGKALATADTVGYDDLVDIQHTVDPAYRNDPTCRYLMHDATLALIRKIKTASDQVPLWQPAMTEGEPDRILGYRYVVDQGCYAPDGTLSAKVIGFGAMGYYLVRNVMGMMIFQQREALIHQGQVGFIGFMRSDGGALWSNTKEAGSPATAAIPFKALTNPAS